MQVYLCAFCKCSSDLSKSKSAGVPSRQELGCEICENKTCHYCYSEGEYKKHLAEVHNIHEPKHIKIDGVEHDLE